MKWLLVILFDDELCQKLEVDLANNRVNLHAFFRRECTLRQLIHEVLELGPQSHLNQERAKQELGLADGETTWDEKEALSGGIYNLLQDIHYMSAVNMWAKQKKPKQKDKPVPPEMLRPPGWKPPKPKMATNKEAMEFFAGLGKNR